jgi:hypothetical protein
VATSLKAGACRPPGSQFICGQYVCASDTWLYRRSVGDFGNRFHPRGSWADLAWPANVAWGIGDEQPILGIIKNLTYERRKFLMDLEQCPARSSIGLLEGIISGYQRHMLILKMGYGFRSKYSYPCSFVINVRTDRLIRSLRKNGLYQSGKT